MSNAVSVDPTQSGALIMKVASLFVLAFAGLAGAACSQPAHEADRSVQAELASADDTASKLNLTLPSADAQASGSGLNLGTPSLEQDGVLIGEDALAKPDLGGEVDVELPGALTDTTETSEDAPVRLPPAQ
jgi:hypothetical protein